MLADYLALPEVVFLRNYWPIFVLVLLAIGFSLALRFSFHKAIGYEPSAKVEPALHVAVLSYTAKPGDTLFLIPAKPIPPDMRAALKEQLSRVATLKGVEVVVLPSEFKVEGRSA